MKRVNFLAPTVPPMLVTGQDSGTNGVAAYSFDGINWTEVDGLPWSTPASPISDGSNWFVIDSVNAVYRGNGQSFSALGSLPASSLAPRNDAFHLGVFALPTGLYDNGFYRTSDFVTFTPGTVPQPGALANATQNIRHDGTNWFTSLIGFGAPPAAEWVSLSPDLAAWSSVACPANAYINDLLTAPGSAWILSGDRRLVPNYGYYTSPTGAVWTQRQAVVAFTAGLMAQNDTGSIIIALGTDIGTGAPVFRSVDSGVTWTPIVLGSNYGFVVWCASLGKFLMGATAVEVATSADGLTWDEATLPNFFSNLSGVGAR